MLTSSADTATVAASGFEPGYRWRRAVLAAVLGSVMAVGVAGCGDGASSATIGPSGQVVEAPEATPVPDPPAPTPEPELKQTPAPAPEQSAPAAPDASAAPPDAGAASPAPAPVAPQPPGGLAGDVDTGPSGVNDVGGAPLADALTPGG